MRKNSFTLIELLIVITIIAVLAGAMVPLFRTNQNEAKKAKAMAELDAMRKAYQLFRLDTGRWPFPMHGFLYQSLMVNENTTGGPIPGWNGPYIDSGGVKFATNNMLNPPLDPWGNCYGWWAQLDSISNPTREDCYICSKGPDGISQSCFCGIDDPGPEGDSDDDINVKVFREYL